MARLRWGILSTARIGLRRVLPAIAASETGALAAIASRAPERARQAAAQFDIPRAHGAYEDLLADPEVDAVYIPLPNSMHKEWTLRAAAAGKHILCEKPIGLNAAEATEMAGAASRAGVLLQEAFMYRHHPQIERLAALVREGAVGRPWLVRAGFTFTVGSDADIRLNRALGGGGLLDVGCYTVSISRLLLGEPDRATAAATFERGVDVRLSGLLTFPQGASALIDCGLRAADRQFCEIVGTEGTVTLLRPFLPGEDPALILLRRRGQEERLEIPGTNQYTRMVDHFGACVLNGAAPRYPAEDAVANMAALDLLRTNSMSTGTD
ncbi:MAG TPA: Gfo/Idh/MocA family oxidoreductase [bacterium]|jgi:predicted dehydrogenase|nr:Gfo/Idh/MocA family oxidoreductase [bacterium]